MAFTSSTITALLLAVTALGAPTPSSSLQARSDGGNNAGNNAGNKNVNVNYNANDLRNGDGRRCEECCDGCMANDNSHGNHNYNYNINRNRLHNEHCRGCDRDCDGDCDGGRNKRDLEIRTPSPFDGFGHDINQNINNNQNTDFSIIKETAGRFFGGDRRGGCGGGCGHGCGCINKRSAEAFHDIDLNQNLNNNQNIDVGIFKEANRFFGGGCGGGCGGSRGCRGGCDKREVPAIEKREANNGGNGNFNHNCNSNSNSNRQGRGGCGGDCGCCGFGGGNGGCGNWNCNFNRNQHSHDRRNEVVATETATPKETVAPPEIVETVPKETLAAPEVFDTLVAPDGVSEKQYGGNFNYNHNPNTNSNGGYYGGRGFYGYGYGNGYKHKVQQPVAVEHAIENASVPDPIIGCVDEYSQVVADRTNFYATATPADIGYEAVDY
ncbi:hypothetical protein BDD12DRAFT_36482 [Trichophaea hybrida]|nr:hypothetical protein BDD12DRAFT_36482 [Trichophaea hybrida]